MEEPPRKKTFKEDCKIKEEIDDNHQDDNASSDKKDAESKGNIDGTEQLKEHRYRQEEESHFLRLFTFILDTVFQIKGLIYFNIVMRLIRITNSFKLDHNGNPSFHQIDFTKYENICGYLYRYGSHGAGFARYRILHALKNNKELQNILEKKYLKVICLGSGTANEAVGLCSALSEFYYPMKLKLTLVDSIKEWSLCIKLAEIFIKEGNFGNVSNIFRKSNAELSFIHTDISMGEASGKDYLEALAEADVILISKVLSTLDRSNDCETERLIIESLHKYMHKDAVIILNDTYFKERWSKFRCIHEWWDEDSVDFHYRSTALADKKFESDDDVTSKLPIHVLSKENI